MHRLVCKVLGIRYKAGLVGKSVEVTIKAVLPWHCSDRQRGLEPSKVVDIKVATQSMQSHMKGRLFFVTDRLVVIAHASDSTSHASSTWFGLSLTGHCSDRQGGHKGSSIRRQNDCLIVGLVQS